MTEPMEVINVRFHEEALEKMDQYKATGFFVSRNHFIRVAVADYMARNPVERIGKYTVNTIKTSPVKILKSEASKE